MAYFNLTHSTAGTIRTQDVKLKPTICQIDIKADNKQRENGEFGFDKLSKSLVNNCVSDEQKLLNEYSTFKIKKKDYYVPWLSIRKGQKIDLEIKTKVFEGSKTGNIVIKGNDNGDFSITLKDSEGSETSDINSAQELEIVCNRTNPNPANLRFEVSKQIAGGINVFYPEPKTVDIECVMVLTKAEKSVGQEKKDLANKIGESIDASRKITLTNLMSGFKKAFNPALLDINIVNNTMYEVNIANDFDKSWLKYFEPEQKLKVIYEPSLQSELLNDLSVVSKDSIKKDESGKKSITLFLTNFINYSLSDDGAPLAINGISRVGKDQALMYLGNSSKVSIKPLVEIAHEIMHCLSLPHVFLKDNENSYFQYSYFKQSSTDNYMDYQNNKKHTYHSQWKTMHLSRFTNKND